jgi:hypothetical protein
MPWTVLSSEVEQARQRRREAGGRVPGTCHDTIDAVMTQASAVLRRRSSEDVSTVAGVITNAPHCVPCIALLTHLDARRIYAALEHLKASANARLISAECRHCHRTTTVHVMGE